MAKPKVREVSGWTTIWENKDCWVESANNFDDYYRVIIAGEKRKMFFYGESAWSDVQRYVADKTGDLSAWSIFQ